MHRHSQRLLLLILAGLVSSHCSGPTAPTGPTTDFEGLHTELEKHVESGQLPGAVHLVMQGDQTLDLTLVGFSDVESGTAVSERSLFRLASATKVMVSVAFLTLVEEGKVALEDTVETYLPEFGELRVFDGEAVRPAERKVTIMDLLRHTGGLGYGDREPYRSALVEAGLLEVGGRFSSDWSHAWTLSEWARRLGEVPLESEPGERFSYGLHHDVLGLVAERVSGQSLDQLVAERLTGPLGLEDTGFVVAAERLSDLTSFYSYEEERLVRVETAQESPFGALPLAISGGGGWDNVGNGGMVSSAPDFARFLRMLMAGGALDGVRILEPSTVDDLMSNHLQGVGTGDSFWPGVGYSYGLAYLYDPDRFPEGGNPGKMWWGGSTNVYFWMDPAEDLVAVFMTHILPFGHLGLTDTVERLIYEALLES